MKWVGNLFSTNLLASMENKFETKKIKKIVKKGFSVGISNEITKTYFNERKPQ